MKLIPDARRMARKLWTVRLALAQAAIGAAATAWVFWDPSRKLTLWLAVVMFILGVAIAAARLIKQKGVGDGEG
jgi:fatty acid desaturase